MPFVQRDHEVETFSSHRVNDAFTKCIRHRRPHGCFEHAHPHIPDTLVYLVGENVIPVMDQ